MLLSPRLVAALLLITLCFSTSPAQEARAPVAPLMSFKGRCAQNGYSPYPMLLQIHWRDGDRFRGSLRWPLQQNSKTRVRGWITDKRLSFVEYELIVGGNLLIPTRYSGRFRRGAVIGLWKYDRDGSDESGIFYLRPVPESSQAQKTTQRSSKR